MEHGYGKRVGDKNITENKLWKHLSDEDQMFDTIVLNENGIKT